MFIKRKPLPRRTFLRGLGTSIALPLLNIMKVSESVAATNTKCLWVYVPCGWGRYLTQFFPAQQGGDYTAPRYLQPLMPYKNEFTVLRGLYNQGGIPGSDGAGGHARAGATYLTSVRALKAESQARTGQSIDRYCAEQLNLKSANGPIDLIYAGYGNSDFRDSGYNSQNGRLSWRNANQPISWEQNPQQIFNQMYESNNSKSEVDQNQTRLILSQSILDSVLSDITRLNGKLGQADRRKLDQYLTGIRESEVSIANQNVGAVAQCGLPNNVNNPNNMDTHFSITTNLILLAFQCDLTRVAVYSIGKDANSYRPTNDGAWHSVSHYAGSDTKNKQYSKICDWISERCAGLISNAQSKGLLDNTLISFGSGTGGDNSQSHGDTDLRTLLIGRGNGANNKTGQSIFLPNRTPIANLWATMAASLDCPVSGNRWGDFGTGLVDLS